MIDVPGELELCRAHWVREKQKRMKKDLRDETLRQKLIRKKDWPLKPELLKLLAKHYVKKVDPALLVENKGGKKRRLAKALSQQQCGSCF